MRKPFQKGRIPWNKGIKRPPFSKEWKEKMKLGHTGKSSGALGKHWKLSIKTRKNQSNANKERVLGGKHNFWKGGISKIEGYQSERDSFEYKIWRESVFKRDNWTCIWCKQHGVELHADHIKPFSLYPELRLAIDNGRTLCLKCHKTTDTYGGKMFKYNKINI